ncbi:MAG: single-stranded-DNA-specific exonuclease RecJ, partial [Candidatus Omnitrophota bacterium]
DGYGLNHEVGSLAKEINVSLLIAVDCGIGANSEVESLNNLGIDVIIVDHHLPSEGPLPKAVAIVNPKRADCGYPFKHLAAVGLVAKLTQALFGEIMEDELDLVAIGTIADVVPLRGENRIFVQNGLPRINQTKNKGLLALLDVAKIKSKKILPRYVGFIIGPRINATGRMDSAQKSLDLLLSKDGEQAYALANFLEKLNTDRQKIQEEIVQEAMSVVEREINFKEHKVIVINKKGWHIGVLGIVASRIAETYYRPTVVVSVNDGVGTASARSIPGFHLYEALTYCAETLESYGGHQGAAGLTIQEDKIDSFRDMINQYASDKVDGDYLKPSLELDCEVPLSLLDLDLVEIIDTMEPYGEGNPPPYFYTRNLIVKSQPSVLGKDTLKFWVSDGSRTISVVGFKMGKYREFVNLGQRVDLAYQLAIDDWNKAPTVQLKLKDMKLSEG